MFGVVLWSDEQEQKAVIWCEDHGDLAFFSNTDDGFRHALDAGDWVQFDITMDRHQRFAHNPRLVCEGVYPDLADALSAEPAAGERPDGSGDHALSGGPDRGLGKIIPFQPAQARKQKLSEPAHACQA